MLHILSVIAAGVIVGVYLSVVVSVVVILLAVASGYRWRTPKGPKP